MKAEDIVVEVRDDSYNKVGQIIARDIADLNILIKYNATGSWRIVLPNDHNLVNALRTPGSGIVVNGPNGVIISGPTSYVKKVSDLDNPNGFWEINGVDDSIILFETLAYPYPESDDVNNQITAYDTRVGQGETIMKGYVSANIGPDAVASRKIPNLVIEPDTELGELTTYSSRFDNLQKVLDAISSVNEIGYTLVQEGDDLVFKVFQPVDRTETVKMDIENGHLESIEYVYKSPEVTRVIVGGDGAAEQRTFLEVSNAASLAAEAEWGRRIELFVDASSAKNNAEMRRKGREYLAEGGKTITTTTVTPSESSTMEYGKDWFLGDSVSVVVNEDLIVNIVKEVAIILNGDGLSVKATVGEIIEEDIEAQLISNQKKHDKRLDNLERNKEKGATSSRESVVFSTPTLAPGAKHKINVTMAPGYRIQSISTTVPSRVRLYTYGTGQDIDFDRPELTYPFEASGLIVDYVSYDGLLSVDLSPSVHGFVRNGSKTVPVTVTNKNDLSTPVQVTIIYIKTES
jgi:hypothetical protein